MDRYKIKLKEIWNVDETGVTKVQTPNQIVAKRVRKQVRGHTSGERARLVTVAIAVNAEIKHYRYLLIPCFSTLFMIPIFRGPH